MNIEFIRWTKDGDDDDRYTLVLNNANVGVCELTPELVPLFTDAPAYLDMLIRITKAIQAVSAQSPELKQLADEATALIARRDRFMSEYKIVTCHEIGVQTRVKAVNEKEAVRKALEAAYEIVDRLCRPDNLIDQEAVTAILVDPIVDGEIDYEQSHWAYDITGQSGPKKWPLDE